MSENRKSDRYLKALFIETITMTPNYIPLPLGCHQVMPQCQIMVYVFLQHRWRNSIPIFKLNLPVEVNMLSFYWYSQTRSKIVTSIKIYHIKFVVLGRLDARYKVDRYNFLFPSTFLWINVVCCVLFFFFFKISSECKLYLVFNNVFSSFGENLH